MCLKFLIFNLLFCEHTICQFIKVLHIWTADIYCWKGVVCMKTMWKRPCPSICIIQWDEIAPWMESIYLCEFLYWLGGATADACHQRLWAVKFVMGYVGLSLEGSVCLYTFTISTLTSSMVHFLKWPSSPIYIVKKKYRIWWVTHAVCNLTMPNRPR